MASVMNSPQIDNDSVVYEHIIPRSVRQRWVRRSSVGSFDQDLLPVDISSQKEISLDTDLVSHDAHIEKGSKRNKDQSIESDHITEEEEIAVFNAWGVKLRHVSKRNKSTVNIEAGDITRNKQEKIEVSDLNSVKNSNETQANMTDMNKQSNSSYLSQNNSRNKTLTGTSPKVIESSMKIKRERPKSMPVISAEKINDYNKATDNRPSKHAAPKAYKSPHAKVPWKRPDNLKLSPRRSSKEDQIVNKGLEDVNQTDQTLIKDDENKDNHLETNDSSDDNLLKEKKTETRTLTSHKPNVKADQHKLIGKDKTSKIVNSGDNEELLSVFQRRKSFEASSSQVKDVVKPTNVKHYTKANGHEVKNDIKQEMTNGIKTKSAGLENQSKTNEKIVSLNSNDHKGLSETKDRANERLADFGDVHQISKLSSKKQSSESKLTLNEQDGNSSQKPADNKRTKSNEPLGRSSNDMSKKTNELGSLEKQQESVKAELISDRPQDKLETKATPIDKAARSLEMSKNKNDIEISSGAISVTTDKGHKRRVGKIVIQSGDLRERQLNLKQKTEGKRKENISKNTSKESEYGGPPKEIKQIVEDSITKSEIDQQCEIPVTNLDDIFIAKEQETADIPVTNLDDIPASTECKRERPQLNLANIGIKSQTGSKEKNAALPANTGKQHFCPIKKVDYNEARQFITPKVYFEKPVGLKSVLSPKQKNKEKKRANVSFSANELEKVHMYPSETAAMELYDEENKNNADVTVINDVFNSDSASENLSSYTPTGFTDIAETLERERAKLADGSNKASAMEDDTPQMNPTYDGQGDLFTESTESTASAILF